MEFKDCKNLLIIRPDNMGDLLMTAPAIRAIKQSFGCKITVLCASSAMEVAGMIREIDDRISFDLPWLKFDSPIPQDINDLVEVLRMREFDGCILFNVYSQNPAPSLMLAYQAGIRLRAAYSRENLYGLLTHWLPDDEPISLIRHQVERDLHLAKFLGATVEDKRLQIAESEPKAQLEVISRFGLSAAGYFILHSGVSDQKRRYPKKHWIALGKMLVDKYQLPLVLTGSRAEMPFTALLANEIGPVAKNLAGLLDLSALAAIIKNAKCMISVNTGPMHLAVALKTPLVALYAQTNPQHQPFQVNHRVLEFSIPEAMQSSNQIIQMVNKKIYKQIIPYPTPQQIMIKLSELVDGSDISSLPAPQGYNLEFPSNLMYNESLG